MINVQYAKNVAVNSSILQLVYVSFDSQNVGDLPPTSLQFQGSWTISSVLSDLGDKTFIKAALDQVITGVKMIYFETSFKIMAIFQCIVDRTLRNFRVEKQK